MEVSRPLDAVASDLVVNEVLVVFRNSKVRDLVISHSSNLAGRVDGTGRPTAGTRIEIPQELKETFGLLARFGTRLRARHGEGTKRHIKFDDYAGSLYTNVKLPGDMEWTRVTPDMAREDIDRSLHEENTRNQKRLAAKLVSGPRDRLKLPMVMTAPGSRPRQGSDATGRGKESGELAGIPPGKRPRWNAPGGQSSRT